jgi:uncharacterized membrane protein YhaH (DUF805 family)
MSSSECAGCKDQAGACAWFLRMFQERALPCGEVFADISGKSIPKALFREDRTTTHPTMITKLLPMLQESATSFEYSAQGSLGTVPTLIILALVIFMIAAVWKVFVKAGEPGWACLIPIYNIIVLLKVSGKPVWWIILFIIPFVNFIISLLVSLGLAKNFGKGGGFGIGLWLLGPIFFPILGFGDAKFVGQKS